MNNLKGKDIAIIVLAIGVVGLLIYNVSNMNSGESTSSDQSKNTAEGAAPTSDEIRSRAVQWSDDPEILQEQMREADRDQTLTFMRYLRERGLPEGYEHPQFLLDAGSGKESARLIGERFPEFYGLAGEALINAAKRYPVKYKEMIEYSLSYRVIYAHEVEHLRKEQAEKEAAQQR